MEIPYEVVNCELFTEFVPFIACFTPTGQYTVKGKVQTHWSGWAKSPAQNFRNDTSRSLTRQLEYLAKLKKKY